MQEVGCGLRVVWVYHEVTERVVDRQVGRGVSVCGGTVWCEHALPCGCRWCMLVAEACARPACAALAGV